MWMTLAPMGAQGARRLDRDLCLAAGGDNVRPCAGHDFAATAGEAAAKPYDRAI
jgi:hypothetical protein